MQVRENRSLCFTVVRSWQNNSKILDRNMQNTTENTIAPAQHELPTVLQRMSDAINAHDVDAFLSCLTPDYQGEQPLHPEIAAILQRRGYANGLAQVRENWNGLFSRIHTERKEKS
jgi:SnoaL-like domain